LTDQNGQLTFAQQHHVTRQLPVYKKGPPEFFPSSVYKKDTAEKILTTENKLTDVVGTES